MLLCGGAWHCLIQSLNYLSSIIDGKNSKLHALHNTEYPLTQHSYFVESVRCFSWFTDAPASMLEYELKIPAR